MTTTQPATTEPSLVLREHGLRVTAQRVAVIQALHLQPHSSADAIFAAIRNTVPGIALPTVHGVLGDLTAAGIATRVSLPDSDRSLFELAEPADNHHHVQCIVCGRVEDVACAVGHAPCLVPSENHGMRVLEAAVTFRAICPNCERNGSLG